MPYFDKTELHNVPVTIIFDYRTWETHKGVYIRILDILAGNDFHPDDSATKVSILPLIHPMWMTQICIEICRVRENYKIPPDDIAKMDIEMASYREGRKNWDIMNRPEGITAEDILGKSGGIDEDGILEGELVLLKREETPPQDMH